MTGVCVLLHDGKNPSDRCPFPRVDPGPPLRLPESSAPTRVSKYKQMFSELDSAAYCRGNQGNLSGLKASAFTANAAYVEGKGGDGGR